MRSVFKLLHRNELGSNHAISKETSVHQFGSAFSGRNVLESQIDVSLKQTKKLKYYHIWVDTHEISSKNIESGFQSKIGGKPPIKGQKVDFK